jgi:hypothetical protein
MAAEGATAVRIAGFAVALGLALGSGGATHAQVLASQRPTAAHDGAVGVLASPAPGRSDRYRQDLVRLRTTFLCKRPAKAGALTAAEKAAFQARLEALNRRYGVHG